jgi:transitional endoplasmic reticulum ATPase
VWESRFRLHSAYICRAGALPLANRRAAYSSDVDVLSVVQGPPHELVTPPRGTDQARTYLVRVAGAVGVRGWPYTALVRNRRNEAANDVRLAQTDCIAVGQRDLVKVDWVDESGHYLKVHFVNGGITTLTVEESFAYRPGDVLWLWQDDGQALALAAPTAAWPETPWIGVVKLITPNDRVVVDIGSRFVEVDNDVSQLETGYTVRGIDEQVTGVLSRSPIKYIDLPSDEDNSADDYKVDTRGLSFNEFGGYAHVVQRARELVELPLSKPDLLRRINARTIKGVVFTGPPGTGKTLLARIVASVSGADCFLISGPEIMTKWYGDSERILRDIFRHASDSSRSVIVIDELDSIAGQRTDDSHEASKRIVATLLTLMDGFDRTTNVVVVATTNRIDDVDIALRRPGRFDWEIRFSMPTIEDRTDILRVSSAHLSTYGFLPHERVASMTEDWSAAELAAIWSEAALLAAHDDRDAITIEDYLGGVARTSEKVQIRLESEAKVATT